MPAKPRSPHSHATTAGDTVTDSDPVTYCKEVLDAGDRRFVCALYIDHEGYHETEDGQLRW